MRPFWQRLLRLLLGLFLYALGIAVTMKANIGYAPWEVFHAGISAVTGVSIGTVSILTGLCLVILTLVLGEKLGLGTLLNMLLIGIFLDLILGIKGLPQANSFVSGIIMMIIGLYLIALASYFYIGSGFGAGPRDSLMVALKRRTGLPIGFCRGTIELAAVIIGWFLGGLTGIGTIISAVAIGFCVQTTFKALKFEATSVKHETFADSLQILFRQDREQDA
jgi:uncharacterized membrane protein YczE